MNENRIIGEKLDFRLIFLLYEPHFKILFKSIHSFNFLSNKILDHDDKINALYVPLANIFMEHRLTNRLCSCT